MENPKAEPEYAAAKIAVWWDMEDCPLPEGYNSGWVRQSLEEAFESLGYSGPVSITAYGHHAFNQTPKDVLRGLASTGVAVTNTTPATRFPCMFSDMLEWRSRNPPPATMMFISDQARDVFYWDLARLQQHTKYNYFLACSNEVEHSSLAVTSANWVWDFLLDRPFAVRNSCREFSPMLSCKTCSFDCQSLRVFNKHLCRRKHAVQELLRPVYHQELDPVTRTWGRNYQASPEYATAPIAVWWNMNDCPIPDGYDPSRVRSSMEAAFKSLGYSGPVSIRAHGDLCQTPDRVLLDLSSTGVTLSHSISNVVHNRMFRDMTKWQDDNAPPATVMFISDTVEEAFSHTLVQLQQEKKYNLFLAYPFRPYKMSILVTSAEWLWDSLLAVAKTRIQLLQKCSERGESTVMIYCSSCYCDYEGLGNFREHLSGQDHALSERRIHASIRSNKRDQELWMKREYLMVWRRKRSGKALPVGFGFFHKRLHLTNRVYPLRARKSQRHKKEW